MAKGGGGVTRLGRDSNPKYLGIKISAGQTARKGMIIIRQRGAKYLAGKNVKRGADDTIYASKDGVVAFKQIKKTKFDGSKRSVKVVSIS